QAELVPQVCEFVDEASQIRQALAHTGGNVARAARLLGMSRKALRYRMRRDGIERPSLPNSLLSSAPLKEGRDSGESPTAAEIKPVTVLAVELTFPSGP